MLQIFVYIPDADSSSWVNSITKVLPVCGYVFTRLTKHFRQSWNQYENNKDEKLCGEIHVLSTKKLMIGLKSRGKSEYCLDFFQFLIPYQKCLFVFGLRAPHWDTDLCGDGQSSSLNQVLLHFYHTNLWRKHRKTQ